MFVMKKVTPLLVRLIITTIHKYFGCYNARFIVYVQFLNYNVILSLHNSNQQNRFIRSWWICNNSSIPCVLFVECWIDDNYNPNHH